MCAARVERHDRTPESLDRGAALDALRLTASRAARDEGRWGLSAIAAAARAGVDPFACCVVAFEQVHRRHPAIGGHADSSTPAAKRRRQLMRALEICDRYAKAAPGQRGGQLAVGEGVAVVCELLAARHDQPIVSLAYYGCRLMQLAKRWRRAAKGLDPITTKIVVQPNGYAKPVRSDWYEELEERLGEHGARKRDHEWRSKRRPRC